MPHQKKPEVKDPPDFVNPILLWLYRHGWEDPDWGTTINGQVILAATIHEMAGQIANETVRLDIQKVTARAIGELSRQLVER